MKNASKDSKSRPRIVHVYKDYYPPVVGGIERTINLMAHGTLDEFDVTVLVNHRGSRRTELDVVEGVRVVRVGEWGRVASASISPAFAGALRKEARTADVLHFHHPNPTGDVAYIFSGSRVPAVMTYHSDVVRQRAAMFAYGRVQDRVMRNMRVIMPTSPQYLASSPWLQLHRHRCHVVPLGIDLKQIDRLVLGLEQTGDEESSLRLKRQDMIELQRLRGADWSHVEQHVVDRVQNAQSPRIVFVGRLRAYKGLEFLIAAMTAVPRATLLLVGGGSETERARLMQIVREKSLEGRVVFLGELTEAEKLWVLRSCDVFCLPSHQRSEAFGLSQVEAMACRLPVVSCRLDTGVSFVNQDGETGVLVEPDSAEALAAGLNKVLAMDRARRVAMGRAGWVRVHKLFSAEKMCGELKRVYRHVLAGGAGAPPEANRTQRLGVAPTPGSMPAE